MYFSPINPDTVKYEMRMVKGVDPFVVHKKRTGGFGRFLSSIGKFLGAIAMPLSFIFPPAMIGALGAYGVGKLGDKLQYNAQMKAMQRQSAHTPTSAAVFPGLDAGFTPAQSSVMNVLYARNDMMMETSRVFGGQEL